ncbi:MAG: M28 family peptidase [Psychroserpens sp.]|uniref:M28 family peptidase n=1 Tax=Psychroserpens sp. TaxID=2020870 RepID=UPI003C9FB81E
MKNLIPFIFSVFAAVATAQNSAPDIEILSVQVDITAQILTVNYALSDADNDACEVWLKRSLDGGAYNEMIAESNITGDIGTNITPNATRTLAWDYSNEMASIETINIRLFASDNQVVDISEMVSQVSETELLNTLTNVVGERNYITTPVHLTEVRNLITTSFENADLQTESQNFQFNSTTMQNILGRKAGAKEENITYIIDGHFDGVQGSPAADDNGSAVAGLLESVRILSQYNFEHSIKFIGFDAEELGLIGSQNYVINGIESFENIQGVLNYEMIGYFDNAPNTQDLPFGFDILFPVASQEVADDNNRGNFIFACGNTTSNPLLAAFINASETYVPQLRVITASVPGNGTIAPDLRRSDHAPFWDGGFQALMITDTSEYRNDNYHTAADTIDTLDLEFMMNVVKATLATAAELAVPISADFDEANLSTVLSVKGHDHEFPAEAFLFPNPSNGMLTLQVNNAKTAFNSRIEVYDLNGKRMHREIITINAGHSASKIDLQKLAVGSYILILTSKDASKSIGFVVGE